MKTWSRHIALPAFLSAALIAVSASAAVQTPASFKLKIYKFAVSTSETCENPILVHVDDNPSYTELTVGPTIGNGHLADGTYKCVMIEMSDLVKFSASQDDGACVAGVEHTMDVCAQHGSDPGGGGPGAYDGGGPGPYDGGGPGPYDGGGPGGGGGGHTPEDLSVKLLDGTMTACSPIDGHEDHVVLYITTASARSGGSGSGASSNVFVPPTAAGDPAHGINLGAPLVVNGAATGTFVVDAKDRVGPDYGECGMQPPRFSFE